MHSRYFSYVVFPTETGHKRAIECSMTIKKILVLLIISQLGVSAMRGDSSNAWAWSFNFHQKLSKAVVNEPTVHSLLKKMGFSDKEIDSFVFASGHEPLDGHGNLWKQMQTLPSFLENWGDLFPSTPVSTKEGSITMPQISAILHLIADSGVSISHPPAVFSDKWTEGRLEVVLEPVLFPLWPAIGTYGIDRASYDNDESFFADFMNRMNDVIRDRSTELKQYIESSCVTDKYCELDFFLQETVPITLSIMREGVIAYLKHQVAIRPKRSCRWFQETQAIQVNVDRAVDFNASLLNMQGREVWRWSGKLESGTHWLQPFDEQRRGSASYVFRGKADLFSCVMQIHYVKGAGKM
jgi:hypothetical protein